MNLDYALRHGYQGAGLQLMKSSLKTPALFPCFRIWLVGFAVASLCLTLRAAPFDAAPFGLPLPEGNGVMWEDPREIHKVVVHFAGAAPAPEKVRLEYWGSRWPEQHLPKDREPGGGSVGWMELGNWYTYQWRVADAEAKADGNAVTFTFRPVNAKEFPNLKDYPAAFRYTLKLRVVSEAPLPKIERIEAFTDSTLEPRSVNLAWKSAPAGKVSFEVFNGAFENARQHFVPQFPAEAAGGGQPRPQYLGPDAGDGAERPARVHFRGGRPEAGRAVRAARRRGGIAGRRRARLCGGGRRPEEPRAARRFTTAWRKCRSRPGAPPGKACRRRNPTSTCRWGSTAGGSGSGSTPTARCRFRSNDHYLQGRPGKETPRLALEPAPVRFRFQPPLVPVFRTIEEACLPIGQTVWETNGVRISQTAFATELNGARADGPVPAADTLTVFLAKFVFTNITGFAANRHVAADLPERGHRQTASVGRERLALARRQRARAGAGRQSAGR